MGNEWDGKAVLVRSGIGELLRRRPVTVELTDEAARKTALALARLKQTTFALPDEVQELLDALNYVLVGDPGSTGAHRRMEAGKGMTPDGGR